MIQTDTFFFSKIICSLIYNYRALGNGVKFVGGYEITDFERGQNENIQKF